MAKKTHPHKMVIFLKKNTKKFAFSVRKPILIIKEYGLKNVAKKNSNDITINMVILMAMIYKLSL